jgi:recombinational DNA repair protein RecT
MAYYETNRGTKKSVYMSLVEIAEHAKAHVKGYETNPNWNDAAKRPTMEMKTVFRQLMGWADLSGTENLKLTEALKVDAGEGDTAEEVVDAEAVAVPENAEPQDVEMFAPSKTDFMVTAAMKAWNVNKKDVVDQLSKLSPMTRDEFNSWLAEKS